MVAHAERVKAIVVIEKKTSQLVILRQNESLKTYWPRQIHTTIEGIIRPVGEALKREIAGLGLVVCCYGDLGGGLALGPV